ncbi:NUDIX hydrolase [Marinobacter hydrocarbonoclasticus]|nr:NUDIX hydrolase [Marinobacter nauticus]
MSQPRFRPNVTVACVVEAQGQYLLVEEQINGETRYNQPAGHLEPGESLVQACRRELREETGLDREPEGLVRIQQWLAPDGTPFVRFTFCLSLPRPLETQPQDPQIAACHWLTRHEIIQRQSALRSPLVLASVEAYEQGAYAPLTLLDDQLAAD